jgi:hypothetical protein
MRDGSGALFEHFSCSKKRERTARPDLLSLSKYREGHAQMLLPFVSNFVLDVSKNPIEK